MTRTIDGSEMNLAGARVRKYRRMQKMSQQSLSDKLETMAIYFCRGSISRIEDRTRSVTDIELFGLACVPGVTMDDLIELPGDEFLPFAPALPNCAVT